MRCKMPRSGQDFPLPENCFSPAVPTEQRFVFVGKTENCVVRDFDHLYDRLVSLQYDKDAGRTIGVHKPGDPIVIRPDHEVRWQHVVNAFNTAVRARYKNIAFAQTQ